MAIPKRGLNNLRTLAGRADQLRIPYRCYMQVTCLEMEKARRGAERRSAMDRVEIIDKRIACIEREKELALLRIAQGPGPGKPARKQQQQQQQQRVVRETSAPAPANAGFKIRY
jgi:hypothetical protein